MKALPSSGGDLSAHAARAGLDALAKNLFRRWPELVGFSVAGGKDDDALYLTDLQTYPWLGEHDGALLEREIVQALFELLDEAPAARELLSGRTFSRTLH